MVEHPLREREVVGSIFDRAIPKAFKMVPVATLLGVQHYKASTGSLSISISIYCHTPSQTFLAGVRCRARLAEKKKIKAK